MREPLPLRHAMRRRHKIKTSASGIAKINPMKKAARKKAIAIESPNSAIMLSLNN